jgi:hypothetical protein
MLTVPARLTNGGRFELLPVHTACVAELFDAVAESKNEISPWMECCHTDYLANETKQWVESRSQAWEQGKEYSFLTLDAQSKQVLGTCGLTTCMPDIDSPTWAIGYVLLGHEKVQRGKRSGCSSILDLQPLGWSGLRLSSQ